MAFGGRPDIVYSGGLAENRVYGGGFAPGTDLRSFVLAERIPHLPGARCRGHSELFDERPADDPYWDAVTERALAVCASCPALGPCEEWLRRLEPASAHVGWWPAESSSPRASSPRDRQMRVRL